MDIKEKLEVINSFLSKEVKELREYIENDDNGWYGIEDCNLIEEVKVEDYDDNMCILSYSDRGGVNMSIEYMSDYVGEEDDEEYEDGLDDWDGIVNSDECWIVVKNGEVIVKYS